MASLTREQIIAKLRARADALRAEGVTELSIFGSRARGDARDDSDLDLLVEVKPNSSFSLLNLVGIEHIAAEATGIHAQATMKRSLDQHMAERIADDVVKVF